MLCSPAANSVLGSQSLSDLSDFTWERVVKELEMHAPVLLSILRDATVTRTDRPNREAITGMCAALLLKHRYFKMSLVQKILALDWPTYILSAKFLSTAMFVALNIPRHKIKYSRNKNTRILSIFVQS